MKKLIALSALALALLVCGCNNLVEDTSTANNLVQKNITVEDGVKVNEACKTVVSETEFDIDGDGRMDKIKLLTSAEEDDGELLLDDSNDWAVYAEINGKNYELLNKKISQGGVKYNIFQNKDRKTVITVTEETTASYIVAKYTYEKEAFNKVVMIGEENINFIASSVDYTDIIDD